MPAAMAEQSEVRIGVDVGGTFTDLVCRDGAALRVVKVPSTPPRFEQAVIEATNRALRPSQIATMVHGSTVATNALLQRTGEPVAFITTEGFRDMLLIGRQNRPKLYDLRVRRPEPICRPEHCFTVRERVDAQGKIVHALDPADMERVISEISNLKLKHVAICLLFSFANPIHERTLARACEAAGLTVSLSSELLPEFREYERACTTVINASLRPVVSSYLQSLQAGMPAAVRNVRIMQSGGGTASIDAASAQACRLVLSGPAGGAFGAAMIARLAGVEDAIGYDMGGTSTDVALILGGQPQWVTGGMIDGLPVGLPMLDIRTVGAGGGSIAEVDAGGALRVGPRSAGAQPGPACYQKCGVLPTVTDANVLLGRILPRHFLGGAMTLDPGAAERVIGVLAGRLGLSNTQTALGMLKVAEANMSHAIRAITARRGHDPRRFALVSFGGAGGLHACAVAESLEMSRVIVPPYCGVLSALGMVVAPPIADASRTVVQLGDLLDDDRLAAEYGLISAQTLEVVSFEQTASVEVYADARFKGQSHELKVRISRPSRGAIEEAFFAAYEQIYGTRPQGRAVEIVTLRVRRIGRAEKLELPKTIAEEEPIDDAIELIIGDVPAAARAFNRLSLAANGPRRGPGLLIDPEATTFIPPGWLATIDEHRIVHLEHRP